MELKEKSKTWVLLKALRDNIKFQHYGSTIGLKSALKNNKKKKTKVKHFFKRLGERI